MSHRSSSPPTSPTSLATSFLSYFTSSSTPKRFRKSSGTEPLLPSVSPSVSPSSSSSFVAPPPPAFSFSSSNHTRKPSDFDPTTISTFTSSLPLPSISGVANPNASLYGYARRAASPLGNEKGGGMLSSTGWKAGGWTKGRMGNVLFAFVFWLCLIWWVRALGGWGAEFTVL